MLATVELPAEEADQRTIQGHRLNNQAAAMHTAGAPASTVLTMLRRALAFLPDNAMIWSNIGLTMWRQGENDLAWTAFERALVLDPTNHKHFGNAGVFASATGNGEAAERYLAEALRLQPDALGPVWDGALLKLWQGQWDKGLPQYEVRIPHKGPELFPGMPYPTWRGEDLTNKTLYVQGEQGVGDVILFSRYLVWVKEHWPSCEILASFRPELTNLLYEFELHGILKLLPVGIPWPKAVDYGCFLCSIPQYHGSMPNRVFRDPGLIRARIDDDCPGCQLPEPLVPSLKVGICWTGNPTQSRNSDRSIPLELLLTLAEDPRVVLYSLQVGPGQKDVSALVTEEILMDLGSNLEHEGWVGTGIVLREMDVVITVCTAIAHLAGSVGARCWTMLCHDPYWIWPRSGCTTPWYPGMKLFRQQALGDWRNVMSEVRLELSALADDKVGPL